MRWDVELFLCRQDNFAALLHLKDSSTTVAIDAPDAASILEKLKHNRWSLSHILVTHHHADHVEGIPKLKEEFNCKVIGPGSEAKSILGLDETVDDGSVLTIGGERIEVIGTPGHTVGHVTYHFSESNLLFAGDTLFSMGCGRVFEGTCEQMWSSLLKLRKLPKVVQLFCGHEYTESNARFSHSILPNDPFVKARLDEVARLRAKHQITLPTTMESERFCNLFLRADDPVVASALGMDTQSRPESVFAELRQRKDRF